MDARVLFTDNYEAIKIYLDQHPEAVNTTIVFHFSNEETKSALHEACWYNRNDIIDLLISKGVDVNIQNTCNGKTPLHWAAGRGHIDVVTKLLDAGADCNLPDFDGNTPIVDAVANNHLHIVKLLTVPSDLLKATSDDSTIILQTMIIYEKPEILEYLLNLMDVHYTKNGWSYLHCAAENNCHKIAEILLRRGIDVNLKNNDGHTAAQLAFSPSMSRLLN